jgi:hypothetical protein
MHSAHQPKCGICSVFIGFLQVCSEIENVMAESEGFEPPIALRLCLISSQVHSTTLPPLRSIKFTLESARKAKR